MRRRDFLKAGAAAAATPISKLIAQPTPATAHVVEVASDFVVRGTAIHDKMVQEMLDSALGHLTGKSSVADAWKQILKPDDIVAIKCNQSGANGLGTTEAFLDALIPSLRKAGFKNEQIIAIEAPETTYRSHEVRRPEIGWTESAVTFASGSDHLAKWLDKVTAIINVPFIKTHNIAGMTCTMKNLSHALVKHPARFHDNGCSPFIGDIYSLGAIRNKVRLHLVNGLRVVFDGGPEARHDGIWDAGIVLAGTDPLAIDLEALRLLNGQRAILGLSEIRNSPAQTPYLSHATKIGLGVSDPFKTRVTRVRL